MAAPTLQEKSQVILIIGANRGVGHELMKRFLSRGHTVYGTYRPSTKEDPSVAQLQATAAKVLEMDLTDEKSITNAVKKFGEQKLDILINVAGVYNLWDDMLFTEQSAEDLMWFFKVNVVGPFLTSKHFFPNLAKSQRGKIINVSSDMASIEDNTGGNACYRIAKCGLNQLTKTQSMDLQKLSPNVWTLAVHPGYVATKMTGFYGEDDMEECMSGLVGVVEKFGSEKVGEETLKNGAYVRWNGETMRY